MENVIRMHGTGHKGRLPPVVSSLFSIKAAHWRDGIRGTELGARGKERTARQRRVIRVKAPPHAAENRESSTSTSTSMSREDEDEDEGPNVYNCVSLSERQAGALALQQDFRSSILSYSILHTPCSVLRHDQVMRRSSWSCCKWG